MLGADDSKRSDFLEWSVICLDQIEDWKIASGNAGEYRSWSRDRAVAFQRAVERRTFDLYKRYFDELGFANWCVDQEAGGLAA